MEVVGGSIPLAPTSPRPVAASMALYRYTLSHVLTKVTRDIHHLRELRSARHLPLAALRVGSRSFCRLLRLSECRTRIRIQTLVASGNLEGMALAALQRLSRLAAEVLPADRIRACLGQGLATRATGSVADSRSSMTRGRRGSARKITMRHAGRRESSRCMGSADATANAPANAPAMIWPIVWQSRALTVALTRLRHAVVVRFARRTNHNPQHFKFGLKHGAEKVRPAPSFFATYPDRCGPERQSWTDWSLRLEAIAGLSRHSRATSSWRELTTGTSSRTSSSRSIRVSPTPGCRASRVCCDW